MSALRYRGAGLTSVQLAELGKVFIDLSDTTPDFLSPKLAVTSQLIKTILNPSGNEQVQLDLNLSGAGGLDTRYIKRSPTGENQTVQPLTDNVSLTIKSFAGGVSDLLDIENSAGTILVNVASSGATTIFPTSDVVSLTLKSFGGLSDILDFENPAGTIFGKVDNAGNLKWFKAISVAPSANLIELTLTPSGGQTVDIMDIFSQSGAVGVSVGSQGQVSITGQAGKVPLTLTAPAIAGDILDLNATSGVTVLSVGNTGAVSIIPSTNVVPVTIQEPTGGTSNILNLKNSVGTIIASVGSTGAILVHPTSSVVGLTAQGATVGTPDIAELKTNAGTTIVAVSSTGSGTFTGPSQLFQPPTTASTAPIVFNDASDTGSQTFGTSSFTTPIAVFINNSTTQKIHMVTAAPGIFLEGTSTGLLFPTLLAVFESDLNKLFTCVFFDAANISGAGTNSLVIGDNGVSLAGNAATGNLKFLAAAGSTADMTVFSSVSLNKFGKTPVEFNRGINEAAPGGAATTKTITFATAEPDNSYGVNITPQANDLIWASNKLTTGFTLNYAVAGGSVCDWTVFR